MARSIQINIFEILRILSQNFLSTAGTVIVAVITYVITKSILDTWIDYRKHIGRIADTIVYYRNVGPGTDSSYAHQLRELTETEDGNAKQLDRVTQLKIERIEELIRNNWREADIAKADTRRLATQLTEKVQSILWYSFVRYVLRLPSKEDINTAHEALIGLSNTYYSSRGDKRERIETIAKSLKIHMLTF